MSSSALLRDEIEFVPTHQAPSSRGLALGLTEPATAFRFLGGELREGIVAQVNSSIGPTFYLDRRFVRLDSLKPCPMDENGLIRSAAISWVGSNRDIPVLTKHTYGTYILVHVDTEFARAKRTIFRERFSATISSNGRTVAWDRGQKLILLKAGDWIEVYCADGSVRKLENDNGTAKVVPLSLEEQAACRFGKLNGDLERNRQNRSGNELMRALDGVYHEFAAMLRVGGGRSEDIFQMAYHSLEDAGDKGLLGDAVREHVKEVLRNLGKNTLLLQFNHTCTRRPIDGPRGESPKAPSMVKTATKPGVPLERRQRLAERAERDRAARTAARGSSQEKPAHQKGGKKKK